MIKLALFVMSGIITFIMFNMGMDHINSSGEAGWNPSWSIPSSFIACAVCIWFYVDAHQQSKLKSGEYKAKAYKE